MNTNGTAPNVSAFVHDLVAMAKAAEELPTLREALINETEHSNSLAQDVQDRETAILRYKEDIETLHAKLKEVEAERDDAQYRFLEADEKANKVLDMVRGVQNVLGETVSTLEPPKPEPVPEPMVEFIPETGPVEAPLEHVGSWATPVETEASASLDKGQSEVDPIPELMNIAAEIINTAHNATESSALPTSDVSSPTPSQAEGIGTGTESGVSGSESGQSVSDPTRLDTLDTNVSFTTESGGSEEIAGASGSDAKPYVGVKYWNLNQYISRADWLAGGGDENDYEWIPERDRA